MLVHSGDLLSYPHAEAEAFLRATVRDAAFVFTPGNHDWMLEGEDRLGPGDGPDRGQKRYLIGARELQKFSAKIGFFPTFAKENVEISQKELQIFQTDFLLQI